MKAIVNKYCPKIRFTHPCGGCGELRRVVNQLRAGRLIWLCLTCHAQEGLEWPQ